MAGIKDYSTTQASNTSLNGINTAEGMFCLLYTSDAADE